MNNRLLLVLLFSPLSSINAWWQINDSDQTRQNRYRTGQILDILNGNWLGNCVFGFIGAHVTSICAISNCSSTSGSISNIPGVRYSAPNGFNARSRRTCSGVSSNVTSVPTGASISTARGVLLNTPD